MVSETREGVIKGKHGYMSPEQCLGDKLDRRSDLFAVGILLWEMTVGRRLYKVNGSWRRSSGRLRRRSEPSKFIEGVRRSSNGSSMARSSRRRARYQTAQEIQLDLEAFALAQRLPVSPVSMTQEMSELFRDRIDAWREAERAGRSLADHLAEVSSEDAPSSGSGDDDDEDLDPQASIELRNRFASEPSAVTVVLPETMPAKNLTARAGAPVRRARRVSQSRIRRAPDQRRVHGPCRRLARADVVVTLLILGGAAAAWMLWIRTPSTNDSQVAPRIQRAALTAESDAANADAAPVVDDIEEQAITEHDPPPIDAAGTEIEDATETAETDPPDIDAVRRDRIAEAPARSQASRCTKPPRVAADRRSSWRRGRVRRPARSIRSTRGPCAPPLPRSRRRR